MKRFLSLTLAAVLVLTMAACGQSTTPKIDTNDTLSIVTTTFAPYDFTRAIVGDGAKLTMLLPPAAESHSFEPTPEDIITIQGCDVFIYVGGESDEWVTDVLSSIDTTDMVVITLMDCVVPLEEEIVEGMEEEDEEEEGVAYDEHVWTSPLNAKLIVQKISSAVCGADPANAALYQENTTAYLHELDELDAEFRAVIAGGKRTTLVFGDRFPFRYLAEAYGLTYYAAFPGCSTETEASAATVAFLIDKVEAEDIPVVFKIELSNGKMADTIAEETGAQVLELHACHNITKKDFESGKTYLELMHSNADALRVALY